MNNFHLRATGRQSPEGDQNADCLAISNELRNARSNTDRALTAERLITDRAIGMGQSRGLSIDTRALESARLLADHTLKDARHLAIRACLDTCQFACQHAYLNELHEAFIVDNAGESMEAEERKDAYERKCDEGRDDEEEDERSEEGKEDRREERKDAYERKCDEGRDDEEERRAEERIVEQSEAFERREAFDRREKREEEEAFERREAFERAEMFRRRAVFEHAEMFRRSEKLNEIFQAERDAEEEREFREAVEHAEHEAERDAEEEREFREAVEHAEHEAERDAEEEREFREAVEQAEDLEAEREAERKDALYREEELRSAREEERKL
jgi:hypothetical protein